MDLTALQEALPPGLIPDAPGESLRHILEEALFRGEEPLQLALRLGAGVLACALLAALGEAWEGKNGVTRLAALLGVAAVSVGGVNSLLGAASAALEEVFAFSNLLLPVMASALTATGHPGTASAQTTAYLLLTDLLTAANRQVFFPLIYAFLALSLGNAAFGGGLGSLRNGLKWGMNGLIGLLAGGYLLALKTTSAISASADAAAVKVTKAALKNLVPVVGKAITDAAESVAAGVALVQNTAGTLGMLGLVALTAGPLLRAAACSLTLKLVSAVTEPLCGKELSGVIGDVGTAMAWAVAGCALGALGLFLSVVAALEAVR